MENTLGLKVIHQPENPSEAAVDIIFVHGLGGGSHGTWFERTTSSYWPVDFLSHDIPQSRILTFGYVASWASFDKGQLYDTASDLLFDLRNERSFPENINRRVMFVAHGLGGIIVKCALCISRRSDEYEMRSVFSSTKALVFLGTPHQGAESAFLVSYFAKLFNSKRGIRNQSPINSQLNLSRTTESILSVQKGFEELLREKGVEINITSFYEELPVPGVGLVVSKSSAMLNGFPHLPLHADHQNICKFSFATDVSYRRVAGELKKYLQSASSEKRDLSSEEQELLLSLYVDDGRDAIGSAANGTCTWLFQHPKFMDWLNRRHGILWLHGKPGSGKSTLVKHLIQYTERRIKESSEELTASFFFQLSGNTFQRTPVGLFQSLLHQFWSQVPDMMSDRLIGFMRRRRVVGKPGKDWFWHLSELQEHLEILMSRASQRYNMCIIIDALDESEQGAVGEVVGYFHRVLKNLSPVALRVCLSSRYNPKLRAESDLEIYVEDENKEDISTVIGAEFESDMLTQSAAQSIRNRILEKASGIFLWAKLAVTHIINSLGRGESIDLLLQALPIDLNSIYQRILDRIGGDKEHRRAQARKMISRVLFALRPLSVDELRVAVDVADSSYATTYESRWTFSESALKWNDSKASNTVWMLKELSWGLLEVRNLNANNTSKALAAPDHLVVHFVHLSVRDYLLRGGLQIIDPDSESISEAACKAHYEIAQFCLEYIATDERNGSAKHGKVAFTPAYSFRHYATFYWGKHAKAAESDSLCKGSLLKYFCWPSNPIICHWVRLHRALNVGSRQYDTRSLTPLHVASIYGLRNLIDAVFNADRSIVAQANLGDDTGRTPLSWAAEEGHEAVVSLLIENGADVSSRDHLYGQSTLSWAAIGGHEGVVKRLIDAGAVINDGGNGNSPLFCAAARGHQAVVRLLLEKGANPNVVDVHRGQSALSIAAARGHGAVISHLLRYGAEPDFPDPCSNWTPLHHAVCNGHITLVELLLPRGTDFRIINSPKGLWTWIDRVVNTLCTTLQQGSHRALANRDENQEPQRPSQSSAPTGGGSENRTSGTRKRNRDESSSGDYSGSGGNGNYPNKLPSLGPAPDRLNSDPPLRLACPYFKYSPATYGENKVCRGPKGWPSVHRLKEHLHRRHYVSRCQRCGRIFPDDAEMSTHVKAAQACPVRDEKNYADGFDGEQGKLLRCRKTRKGDMTEEDYWKEVYKILFPGVDESEIPTAFYEDETLDFAAYDEFCARARSQNHHIRVQLESILQNPAMVDNILNVINDSQAGIRQKYLESQRAPASGAEQDHAQPSDLPRQAAVPLPNIPIRAYEPMPIDSDGWGSGRHHEYRSPHSYPEDSGYYTRPSAHTHSDENAIGSQWQNDVQPSLSNSHINPQAANESESQSLFFHIGDENNSMMENSDIDLDDLYPRQT